MGRVQFLMINTNTMPIVDMTVVIVQAVLIRVRVISL